MAIPGFQDFLLPLLQFCADGKGHTVSEAADYCYKKLELSEEDLKVKTDKGTNIAYNRLTWAKTYLTQAKLLDILQRGVFLITDRGREVLAEQHSELMVKDLKRFDEFMAFYGKKKDGSPSSAVDPVADNESSSVTDKTPEERIEEAWRN